MTSPLSKLSNLGQRVIAGIIGAAIIINAIYWSMWSFLILFSLIALLSQWEFYSLLKKAGYKPMVGWGMFVGFKILLFTVLRVLVHTNAKLINVALFTTPLYYFIFISIFISFIIKLYDKEDTKPFINLSLTLLGGLYVVFSWSLFLRIGFPNMSFDLSPFIFNVPTDGYGATWVNVGSKTNYSYQIPLGILLMLWASDSGAYFAGKKFGKTKLFERISPKKTWEGSIGGLLLSMLVAFVLSIYFKQLPSWQWFALSAIIVVIGSYGDLVESMLKRSIHIKDSGSVIPGHGGFLDRFDGLLLAAPFIWVFLRLFQNI